MKFAMILCALVLLTGNVFAESDHDSDEILLQLSPGVSIDTINNRYGTTTEEVLDLIGGPVYKVKVADEADLDAIVAAMETDPDIAVVEFNYFGESPEAVRRTIAVIDSDPNPSKFHDQEAYNRIKAAQAQTISTGQGVIVAVIDTGVDYNHPDLAGHMLRNASNQIVGYDFLDNDSDPMDSTNGIDDDLDGLTDEGAGHGTHVAGIISLVAPGAKIMPLRVLNSDGYGTADLVAKAIDYVYEYSKENKVPAVINLSLGLPSQSLSVLEAIQEALSDGIPVIASAGNDNSSALHYPAANDAGNLEVVSVTATDQNAVKAGFANYGKGWIDLSAPGVGIYSTFLNGGYAWWDGTSMSAPFVSGEAALVVSLLALQDLEEDQLLAALLPPLKNGVDSIYEVNPSFKKGQQLGNGNMDAYSAVLQAQGSDVLSVKKASYSAKKRTISITAKSNLGSAANLTVQGFGAMKYNPSSKTFKLKMGASTAPVFVNIVSDRGGVITAYVGVH